MTLNIRDFPDGMHRKLKILSGVKGCSLKDVVVEFLEYGIKKHIKFNPGTKAVLEDCVDAKKEEYC